MKYLLILTLLAGCSAPKAVDTPTQKQKILLIGDSITYGWGPYAAIKTDANYQWTRVATAADNTDFQKGSILNTTLTLLIP